MSRPTDRRYHGSKWRRTAQLVTRNGTAGCWAPGCSRLGNVADHVRPVYPGMPDAEFYDRSNLRPSCRRHNLLRGHAAALERETSRVVTADYTAARTIFSRRPRLS
jgi:hypothetical protein